MLIAGGKRGEMGMGCPSLGRGQGRGEGTHLVCGGLGRRVARGGREGQEGPAAPRIRCRGVPAVREAPVAQRCCPPWDPRWCERASLKQSSRGCRPRSAVPRASLLPVPWGTHRQDVGYSPAGPGSPGALVAPWHWGHTVRCCPARPSRPWDLPPPCHPVGQSVLRTSGQGAPNGWGPQQQARGEGLTRRLAPKRLRS